MNKRTKYCLVVAIALFLSFVEISAKEKETKDKDKDKDLKDQVGTVIGIDLGMNSSKFNTF